MGFLDKWRKEREQRKKKEREITEEARKLAQKEYFREYKREKLKTAKAKAKQKARERVKPLHQKMGGALQKAERVGQQIESFLDFPTMNPELLGLPRQPAKRKPKKKAAKQKSVTIKINGTTITVPKSVIEKKKKRKKKKEDEWPFFW